MKSIIEKTEDNLIKVTNHKRFYSTVEIWKDLTTKIETRLLIPKFKCN